MYEVSPDYGMMTQAWNIYAFGEPIIEQFFGIKPLAYKKEITIAPLLPAQLTNGKIENVATGNNEITFGFSKNAAGDEFVINQKSGDWTIIFSQPKGKYKNWIVNNKPIQPEVAGEVEQIRISGRTNHLKLVNQVQ